MNVSPGLVTDAETPAASFAGAENVTAFRLDFAELAGGRLLVYGWIVNFSKALQSATIHLGSFSADLLAQGIPVRRPDVAQHFELESGEDEHGFYALFDLPVDLSAEDHLDLRLQLSSGEVSESRWPVFVHDAPDALSREPYLAPLSQLLKKLPKHEAMRLVDFVGPSMKQRMSKEHAPMLPPPIEFGIDLCCVLDHRVLVVAGWRVDPFREIAAAEIKIGHSTWPFWRDAISFARADVHPSPAGAPRKKSSEASGFIFIHEFVSEGSDTGKAAFVFTLGEETIQLTHAITSLVHIARLDLLAFFRKMEPDLALTLSKRVATHCTAANITEPLPSLLALAGNNALEGISSSSIHNRHPRYFLHIDQAIPVANTGIFLTGWFDSAPGESVEITCHLGQSSLSITDHWFRHPRPDVSSHLANLGIHAVDHAHGFTCYVTLSGEEGPYYIAVTGESGESRYMRVAITSPSAQPMQVVRSLLTSFHSAHPELRSVLDRQIGPAVSAAWSSTRESLPSPVVRAYGSIPANPVVSIVVPLYGRYDFAAYQLALFANDPEFENIELIYVVDDPSILADFARACYDLQGIYGIPFLVASCGKNLGFAGANNLASRVARGRYLLFLNSDVMPRRAGWVGDLVRTYESLSNPGMLGAKLLYEDGSIQHAGIAFQRYPGWGNLWINDHPFKGQSPLGLAGVRRVHAVTAACALTKASLFHEAGGFSEDYIIGDFEDTDLCLWLESRERPSYIALDVELYHLERQSQNRLHDPNWRTNLTLYNCWLHSSRWDRFIANLTEDALTAATVGSGHRESLPTISS